MARRNRKMCVKIAQDVLAQLRLGRYSANPGDYVLLESPELDELSYEEYEKVSGDSFKTFFKKNKNTSCNVCALGAAFVSLVNIENKCSVDEIYNLDTMWDRLGVYFGGENMALMETAFEMYRMNSTRIDISDNLLDQAVEWGRRYCKDDNKRLRMIMLNVIRNNGDFKLPQKMVARARALDREYAQILEALYF